MKFTIAFLALFLSSFVGKAKAQLVPYDSLAVNSLYGGAGNVPDADNIEGPPDDAVVTLGSTSFISAQFFAGSQLVTLQKGAEMHVYWLRLNNTDSAAADIYFTELNDGVAERSTINPTRVMENTPTVNQLHETTIVVPDTGYNTLSITIGADTGASIAWLDAIILMQSGVAAVGEPSINVAPLLTSYPNPFEHGAMAKVRYLGSHDGNRRTRDIRCSGPRNRAGARWGIKCGRFGAIGNSFESRWCLFRAASNRWCAGWRAAQTYR